MSTTDNTTSDSASGSLPTSVNETLAQDPSNVASQVKANINELESQSMKQHRPQRSVYNPTVCPPMPYIIGDAKMDNDPYGLRKVTGYVSPYSSNPSANSGYGRLTFGNLPAEFEGNPVIGTFPQDNPALVQQRTDPSYKANLDLYSNPIDNMVSKDLEATPTTDDETKKSVRDHAKSNGKRSYPSGDNFFTQDPTYNGNIEQFSHKKEKFTTEQKNTAEVIFVGIIVVCVVGVCFGLLIPTFRVQKVPKLKTSGGWNTNFSGNNFMF